MSDIAASAAASIRDPRLSIAPTSYAFPSEVPPIYTVLYVCKYQRSKNETNAKHPVVSTIRLPLPQSLVDSYGAHVSSSDLSIAGVITRNLSDTTKLVNDVKNMATEGLKVGKSAIESIVGVATETTSFGSVATNMARALSETARMGASLLPGISDTKIGRAAQVTTGYVPNPHTVSTFDGMALKSYSLQWKMSPRNQSEANTIQNIITILRNAMHPKEAIATFALTYPNIVRVEYKGIKSANVRYSFIKSLSINNYGFGSASFFRDGNPVAVELSIELQELETLVADTNGNVNVTNTTLTRLF